MGKLSELINQMIGRSLESAEFTSANPTHVNTLIQINEQDNPDIEAEIKKLLTDNTTSAPQRESGNAIENLKQQKDLTTLKEKFDVFDKGNVGDIQRLTAEQFGNVRSLASNPTGFIMGTFMRKIARGAGVIAFALLIFEAVKWIMMELTKPGRLLDIRFRRNIEQEILAFKSREEKQKLNQGFSQIIVSSMSGLRGGTVPAFNSYRTVASGQSLFEKNFQQPQVITNGADVSKNKGGRRFGR